MTRIYYSVPSKLAGFETEDGYTAAQYMHEFTGQKFLCPHFDTHTYTVGKWEAAIFLDAPLREIRTATLDGVDIMADLTASVNRVLDLTSMPWPSGNSGELVISGIWGWGEFRHFSETSEGIDAGLTTSEWLRYYVSDTDTSVYSKGQLLVIEERLALLTFQRVLQQTSPFQVVVGPAQVASLNFYIGWSTDMTFTVAQLQPNLGKIGGDGAVMPATTFSDARIGVWLPNSFATPPSGVVRINGQGFLWEALVNSAIGPQDLTIDGVEGRVFISGQLLRASFFVAQVITVEAVSVSVDAVQAADTTTYATFELASGEVVSTFTYPDEGRVHTPEIDTLLNKVNPDIYAVYTSETIKTIAAGMSKYFAQFREVPASTAQGSEAWAYRVRAEELLKPYRANPS